MGKLSEENYPKWVKVITGFSPCPICNGPVKRNEFGNVRCVRHPCHSVVARLSVDRWDLMLGKICEHGYYMAECKECVCKEATRKIELVQ